VVRNTDTVHSTVNVSAQLVRSTAKLERAHSHIRGNCWAEMTSLSHAADGGSSAGYLTFLLQWNLNYYSYNEEQKAWTPSTITAAVMILTGSGQGSESSLGRDTHNNDGWVFLTPWNRVLLR